MKRNRKSGSAVLIVLGIIAVVSIAIGMLDFTASQQMRAAQITREILKARLIAESGLNKAYLAVKKDFSKINSYSENAAFGDGTYAVKSVPLASNGELKRAQLVSRGVCGLGQAVVSVDLENRPIITPNDGSSGDYFSLLYDLLVGGTLDLKGNFGGSVDAIQSNGDATLTGSAHVEAMTVSSAGTVRWKRADGSVTLLSNQSSVEILSAALSAAINRFIDYAKENNAVYASGADIPASPPGGVAYCTGDSSGWSRAGSGCFIFAGDASFQGNAVDVSSVNGYPAIIVMGTGEVKFNSGSEVHGAILVPNGSVRLNGHAVFYGPIVVGQGMVGNGTADLYAGDGQGFTLPPGEDSADNVVVTAWH